MPMPSVFRSCRRVLAASGLMFLGALVALPAVAQILNSKHDLSSGSTASTKQSNTSEVCVFCHTPHGASSTAPLWNRGDPASSGSFTVYSSNSMQGTALQPTNAGSGLCLSCHDGATALDLLVNAPDSGYGVGTGLATSQGYTWSNVSGTNLMLSTSIANLGANLANDHPIGIPYCGGATAGACADPDFNTFNLRKAGSAVGQTNPTAVAGENWWVDTTGGTAGTREKTDMPLYVRDFSGTLYPAVECQTCHEPHTTTNATFLRISNDSSLVCRTCHNK